ncbi:MAG: hypothetical protein IJ354_09890 [Clostridia bacterium]|nr:hypothetical protein [Clostridia bacterium]
MKKHAVLLCFLVGASIMLYGCQQTPPMRPVPEAALTYLSFNESSSYFKRVQNYEFRLEEGKANAFFWLANEEEPYAVPVDQEWMNTLTGFIRQYGLMGWDGFSGSASGLLDGTRFEMDFSFADGTAVHASGYGKFPNSYGEASSVIDVHFMQLLPEEMRDW